METKETNQKIIEEVITYFNKVTNQDYKPESKATVKVLVARLKEGYGIEDFKIVVDSRNQEWPLGSAMRQYLRPTTLFNEEKFESYLNFAKTKQKSITNPKMDGMVM